MRTLMFVLVCLLLVSCAFALESGPSNKVGYVKIYCPGFEDGDPPVPVESYQEFGLPFRFWDVPGNNVPTYGSLSNCPSDIVGTQAQTGSASTADQVLRQDDGTYAYRNPGGVWSSLLEVGCGMVPATAYWFKNMRGYDIDLILAGDADLNATGIPTVTVYGAFSPDPADAWYQPYSWRDPRELTMDQTGLLPAGFTGGANASASDKVLQQGLSGFYAWYKTTGTPAWQGLMSTVVPGEGYWIANFHEAHDYDYTFASPGALMAGPTSTPANATIAKFKHSLVKKAPVKARAIEQ